MEQNGHEVSTAIRRRRRAGRPVREKTPDPSSRRTYSDSSSQFEGTTASEEVQTVRMQIRLPATMSAHESKILRRRDKTFATQAARSHSQPREAERLTSPEADRLLLTYKRSLSSPRHKDESSENELTHSATAAPPAPPERSSSRGITTKMTGSSTADENLSRLEQNLRRFEDERQRFEAEKRHFEREKREHKMRYKQAHDSDERRRLVEQYRKLSDRINLPTDPEERRRLVHSLRLQRNEAPTVRVRSRHHSGYEESSTQFSSSDADTAEELNARRLNKQLSPARRHVESIRGPPPLPPKAPERRTVSRNNSLSPIRPQRRSRTPEQRAEMIKKLSEIYATDQSEATEKGKIVVHKLERTPSTPKDGLRRRRSLEEVKASPTQIELRRRKSLERYEKLKRTAEATPKVTDVSKITNDATVTVPENNEPANEPTQAAPIEKQAEQNIPTLVEQTPPKSSFLQRLFIRLFEKSPKTQKLASRPNKRELEVLETTLAEPVPEKILSIPFLRYMLKEARLQWLRLKADYPLQLREMKLLRNKCISHTIILILLVGFGGLMFRYTEGTSENIYKCEVRKVKRDFIDNLWTVSHNMREDDWKSLARQKLRKFEDELHELQELGVRRQPGMKSWNFVNCILYCWTVITTIGYGHITPKTTSGRSLTIIYAIIGIPMFLILLADFGKLFTRAIKFLWAYVRRCYYTGTIRKIRKQQQVSDVMSGFNTMYDMAIRRPSNFFGTSTEHPEHADTDVESQSRNASHPDTPTSPYPETYEVDDEFNLPVSLASILLISYILIGAAVYYLWEKWTYFEAFYFVFISMSTIGFGDMVPDHPMFMMCSIIYLIFGLALTSMFINVVQIKLSDTFKQASAKISATIGMGMASEMGDEAGSQLKTPSDLASVHGSRLDKIAELELEAAAAQRPPLTSILRPPKTLSPTSNESYRDENGSEREVAPPPILPKRQVEMEPNPEPEKPKKKRFFK